MKITREIVIKVRDIVDAGLSNGLGRAGPGQMCVEAAVCYALGLPHGDDPKCIAQSVHSLEIRLNDSMWLNNAERAKGMRRLAIAQLGSKGVIDENEFAKQVATLVIKSVIPKVLRLAASFLKRSYHQQKLIDCALRCELEGTKEAANAAANADAAAYATIYAYAANAAVNAAAYAANAAYAAADAADAAAEKMLSEFAEGVVQILIGLGSPGCEFLDLVPVE